MRVNALRAQQGDPPLRAQAKGLRLIVRRRQVRQGLLAQGLPAIVVAPFASYQRQANVGQRYLVRVALLPGQVYTFLEA